MKITIHRLITPDALARVYAAAYTSVQGPDRLEVVEGAALVARRIAQAAVDDFLEVVERASETRP